MYFDITNQVHGATLSAIKNPMIRECITYLDTHYREKINLEELANTLGYTKYYLSTCFKKETGVSISEYIMEKRIAYAKLTTGLARLVNGIQHMLLGNGVI